MNQSKIKKLAFAIGKELKREGYDFYSPSVIIIPSNDKDADITISGGEPLLHPEVWKFIEVIDKKNIGDSLIITNATLIDKEKAKKRGGFSR